MFRIIEFNEANYMEDIIKERQEDVNKIENIMLNVNQLVNDLAVEVHVGGEKIGNLK